MFLYGLTHKGLNQYPKEVQDGSWDSPNLDIVSIMCQWIGVVQFTNCKTMLCVGIVNQTKIGI